eukprot:Skav207901  [mRNA]  locus=scaffold190:16167:21682:+ [translate_table: standard]
MSDPTVWQGRRPKTLINPVPQEIKSSQVTPQPEWFQVNVRQLLELRPNGWGSVDFQGAVKVAKGEKLEDKTLLPSPARILTGKKVKGIS